MPKPGRSAGLALAAVLALSVLAGCRSRGEGAAASVASPSRSSSSAATPTTAASSPVLKATRVVRFRAFASSGALATTVRSGGSGQCFTTSITVPLAHVYRCFGNKEILDPCFAAPTPTSPGSVLCYDDPWSAARKLTLTAPLPRPMPLPHPRPWALQLANGARCLSVTGTVPIDRGVALTYSCSHGGAAALKAGHAGLVTASYARTPQGPLSRVAVTTMWTG
jgi:hypothetical protein